MIRDRDRGWIWIWIWMVGDVDCLLSHSRLSRWSPSQQTYLGWFGTLERIKGLDIVFRHDSRYCWNVVAAYFYLGQPIRVQLRVQALTGPHHLFLLIPPPPVPPAAAPPPPPHTTLIGGSEAWIRPEYGVELREPGREN